MMYISFNGCLDFNRHLSKLDNNLNIKNWQRYKNYYILSKKWFKLEWKHCHVQKRLFEISEN